MPTRPVRKIVTNTVTKVLLRGGTEGWIDIVPGSFTFTSLNFFISADAENEEAFTGLEYLGFSFVHSTTGKTICIPSDGIAGIELDEGDS